MTKYECLICHTDEDTEYIIARSNQWANSLKALGGTYERSDVDCAGCHTSEGFLDRMNGQAVTSPTNPGPIGCFTCHAPHTNGDLSLRTEAAVTFEHDGSMFDYGMGNLCANCHQSRAVDEWPIAADPATTTIDNKRWGPHHGPQANMLSGTGGHQFAGTAYRNSYHTTGVQTACIECHMAAPYGSQVGGHQFGLTYEYHGAIEHLVSGCNISGCHGVDGLDDFNPVREDYDGDGTAEGVQDEILGLMDQLRTELFMRGLIDADDYVVADDDNPLTVSELEAGAIYNFRYVLEDRSNGIHNTKYAVDILKAALDNLPAATP